MTASSNTLSFDNIGIRLLARKDHVLYNITHAGMYAQTTDALLAELDGIIAHSVNDAKYTVIASLVAPKNSADTIWESSKVKDLSTPEKPFLPLYVEAGGSLYQVAGLFPAKGDNDDDAVREGNALMLKRQDTALICSTEATQSGEVATIHIVSSLAKAA